MKCPQCKHENPDRLKFCGECGARLASICSACGTSNAPTQKFCGECGAALTQGAPAAKFASPESYTPKHLAEKILTSKSALEGERKQVTVLFADLKGSMELLADRDPEEARKLLDPVLEHMMEAVHRYEGTVNQVMGDGIMALFGAPLAHEDHAVRACYVALAMQSAIRRYTEELRRAHGIEVQIRVGLNSGEVVVRSIGSDLHMDYTAVGQTTHLAARMEQLATPGSIRLTAETLRLAEGFIQVTSLGLVPVKGLPAPVEVFELTGAGPIRTRMQAAAARGLTRFVGRDAELEQLHQALKKAHGGHGQLVALVGEPGVGKSRVFWEFTQSHRTHGWLVLESGSVSYGKATPYLPVVDLLKAYFQVETRDDARKIREKITGKLLTLDRALEPTLTPFLALLDVPVEDRQWEALDPPQRRQRTLDSVKRLLLRESQAQPLLLVFEDLHWIDLESQALLDSLVESLPTTRILLLVNYRPEYQHGWGSKTYYTQLRIDPLPAESAGELLLALLGADASLEPLKRLLIERTEGNPFFLEESVRTLVETGVLAGERAAYQLARALPSIHVPATVQAVLAARIDRLPPEEKSLLQTAAVIGKDVPFTLLQAIAELPEEGLRRGITHLQAGEFLYEASLFPELEYTFKHALTHEVAYGSLLQERRRALHARIVEAMERLYADRLAEQVDRLAHHAVRGEVWGKAVTYLHQAGAKAFVRSANMEAVSLLATGLELVTRLPPGRERLQRELELQAALCPALMATRGDAAHEVGQAYARARELAEQVGESLQLFRALYGLFRFRLTRAENKTARELGAELLTLAQAAQDPDLLLIAHRALGNTLFRLGEMAQAREHLEEGIALYDPERHRTLAFLYGDDPGVDCHSYGALALWWLGYPDRALARVTDAVSLARKLAHPLSLTRAFYFIAWLHRFRGDGKGFQEGAKALAELSREQGFVLWKALGTVLLGSARAQQGHGEEGISEMRQGLAAFRATGAAVRPYFLSLLAEGYGSAGKPEEGLAVLGEALALVEETEERWWEAELWRLQGELLLRLPVPAEEQAESCFNQALAISRRQLSKSWELRATTSLSRLWEAQGRRQDARRMLSEIYGWFTEGFDTRDLQEAKALLEEL